MIHLVQKATTRGFILVCTFSNAEIVEYDMTNIHDERGTMAQPLKKPTFFSKVFVESGTPTWPNGYDVCPETIYLQGKRRTVESKNRVRQL